MKRFHILMAGFSAVWLVAALASPTLAAKTVLADQELDEVTAAGQPKISRAQTEIGSATSTNFQMNVFAAHIGGQEELTALTFNNIFGENQIANGVNIQSSSGANSGLQANAATQSWGSAKAWKSTSVAGAPGGNAECGALGIIAKCVAEGGDASDGKIALLWEFADEIADAATNNGPATAANVVITIVAGTFDEAAQTNLTALTVNNIFGFNQVANGLNISSGAVTTTPGTADASGSIAVGAGGGSATSQANTAEQWRGAPKGWNAAPTFF